MSDKIKAVLDEWKRLHYRTTPGDWDETPASEEWKRNKANNAAFMRYAANNSSKLIAALELATDTVKRYCDCEGDDYPICFSCIQIKKIESILTGAVRGS